MEEKIRILIADNNDSFRDNLVTYFRHRRDIEIVGIAETGEEAVTMAITKEPDIMILDIILPGMDGLWVLEELHARRVDKIVMSIVLTTIDNDNIAELAIGCGAMYYMVKPVSFEVLERRIRQITRFVNIDKAWGNDSSTLDEKLEHRISEILSNIGISARVKGLKYLKKAIFMAVKDNNIVNNITKQLYPEIAKAYDTTPSKVERAMRHAIESSWERGAGESYNILTNGKAANKPTNGNFIANIAEYIKINKL